MGLAGWLLEADNLESGAEAAFVAGRGPAAAGPDIDVRSPDGARLELVSVMPTPVPVSAAPMPEYLVSRAGCCYCSAWRQCSSSGTVAAPPILATGSSGMGGLACGLLGPAVAAAVAASGAEVVEKADK